MAMEVQAVLRYDKGSPRKARLVADQIRGRRVEEALEILAFSPKRAARTLEKLLRSAIANGEEKEVEDVDALRIARIYVDQGPSAKRWRPRARGRATSVRKRTRHITLVLSD